MRLKWNKVVEIGLGTGAWRNCCRISAVRPFRHVRRYGVVDEILGPKAVLLANIDAGKERDAVEFDQIGETSLC